MPIERRIREGAERNAGVLDPDVDRFLESVVTTTRRRQVVRRSLSAFASVAALVVVVAVGPSVLDGIEGSGPPVPGSDGTPSLTAGPTPSVTPQTPLITGAFTRTIPEGTAVVRANGLAGTWTIDAAADGVRLVAPSSFDGARVSSPFEMRQDGLTTDAFGEGICSGATPGTYRWTLTGGVLVLTVESDPCDARVAVLAAKPWTINP